MNIKTQLLCTFTDFNDYRKDIDSLTKFYNVVYGKVYVLQNQDNLDELLLTYNIKHEYNKNFYKKTISVHRKKDSNTIYTINSLNSLIRKLNNNNLDENYQVNWSNYKNVVLLVDESGNSRVLPTKLFKIIKI